MKKSFFLLLLSLMIFNLLTSIEENDVNRLDKIYQEEDELNSINSRLKRVRYLKKKKEELIQKNDSGNQSYVEHEFFKDSEKFLSALAEEDEKKIKETWYEINVCYKKIDFLKNQIKYLDALLKKSQNENTESISILKKILEEDVKNNLKTKVVNALFNLLWQEVDNDSLIKLFENNLINNATSQQQYFYAQALYEENQFDKAREIFERLESVQDYSANAKMMLGLIVFNEEDYLAAKDYFLAVPEESREPFIILTLARIYSLNKEFESAINSYKLYIDKFKNNPPQDIIYEVANNYYYLDKFEIAKNNLNIIIENPKNDEIYNNSKFLYATILQREGKLEEAKTFLNEEKDNIDKIIAFYKDKNEVLREIDKLVADFGDSYIEEEKEEFVKKVESKQSELKEINQEIKKLSHNLAEEDIKILKKLENEIVTTNEDLIKFSYLINYLNNTPSDDKAQVVQNIIDESNMNKNILKAFYYCANLDRITEKDFQLALDIVYELEKANNMLDLTAQIRNRINNETIKNKTKVIEENLNSNIASLNLIGNYYFSETNKNTEIKEELMAELDLIMKRKDTLTELKDIVYNQYNKKLAERQKDELTELIAQSNNLNKNYKSYINDLKSANLSDKKEYDYSIMKILFDETLKKDKEYNAKKD